MIRNVGAKRHCQPNLRSGRTEPMPQSFVKVDRKQHFKETCFNHVHRTSFFRELEKLKRKQVNSTARSADMAERRAAKHCCLRCHLWIVSFKGKSVFNRLLGNSWSNLNYSNRPNLVNVGLFLPKCANVSVRAIFFLQGQIIENCREGFRNNILKPSH